MTPENFRRASNRALIPFVLATSILLTGCLGSSLSDESCEVDLYRLEGDQGDAVEITDYVVMRTGERIDVRAEVPEACGKVTTYRWLVMDTLASVGPDGFATGTSNGVPPTYDTPGGFGIEAIETTIPEVTVETLHVGKYKVRLVMMDESGTIVEPPPGHAGFSILSYHVHRANLPVDGSTYETTFTAFCCPGAIKASVLSTKALIGTQWEITFYVDRTDEVIWRGYNPEWGNGPFEDALGYQWLEVIRVEAKPDSPVPPTGTYEFDLQAGPIGGHYWDQARAGAR